jgi:hypothetical protein
MPLFVNIRDTPMTPWLRIGIPECVWTFNKTSRDSEPVPKNVNGLEQSKRGLIKVSPVPEHADSDVFIQPKLF